MSPGTRALGLACLALALGPVFGPGGGGAARAQYLLTPDSGGQLQIGESLPQPVGSAGIFTGGTSPATAGPPFWPPLGVPAVPAATTPTRLDATLMATAGGGLVIPPGVLSRPAPGTPQRSGGLFPANPALFQVATSARYAWPAATATLAPGGAPGIVGTTVVQSAQGGSITYRDSAAAFGGPGRFSIEAGPGAAGGRLGPNAASVAPLVTRWVNFQAKTPLSATRIGLVGASNPAGLGQPGAPTGAPPATTMWGPVTAGNPNGGGVGGINLTPSITYQGQPVGITCCGVTPDGSILDSLAFAATFPGDTVTGSKGFPWTTGFITLSHPAASPVEIFFQSGTDMRVAGVGNISLVSGALSNRALSGPTANRGWLRLTLPEPAAALGAAGALGLLGLCHGWARGLSRRTR